MIIAPVCLRNQNVMSTTLPDVASGASAVTVDMGAATTLLALALTAGTVSTLEVPGAGVQPVDSKTKRKAANQATDVAAMPNDVKTSKFALTAPQ